MVDRSTGVLARRVVLQKSIGERLAQRSATPVSREAARGVNVGLAGRVAAVSQVKARESRRKRGRQRDVGSRTMTTSFT
jgi:hypothetical protein